MTLSFFAVTGITHFAEARLIRILGSRCVVATGTGNLSGSAMVLGRTLEGTLVPIVAILNPLTTNLLANSLIMRGIFTIPNVNSLLIGTVGAGSLFVVSNMTVVCDTFCVAIVLVMSMLCKIVSPEVHLTKNGWSS